MKICRSALAEQVVIGPSGGLQSSLCRCVQYVCATEEVTVYQPNKHRDGFVARRGKSPFDKFPDIIE